MAIVTDEEGKFYYIRCEEQMAPIGTMVSAGLAEPIEELSSEELEQVKEYILHIGEV